MAQVINEYKDTQHLQSGGKPLSSHTHTSKSKSKSNSKSNNQGLSQTNNPSSSNQQQTNNKSNAKQKSSTPKSTKASVNTKSNRSAGRPRKPHPFRTFKNAATGETRNSPFTNPNIIFLVGGSLIIASQWTRIKKAFGYAWDVNKIIADGPGTFYNDVKVIGVQVLFIFILTITARAVPALGRIWLVIIGGLWILWLMRNPEILQLLQAASE